MLLLSQVGEDGPKGGACGTDALVSVFKGDERSWYQFGKAPDLYLVEVRSPTLTARTEARSQVALHCLRQHV